MKLTPKDWTEFQHYKDRSPPWIKLHKSLLNNFEFNRLPVASRALAPLLWLLASEYEGGIIDASEDKLCFRLHVTKQELYEALHPLVEAEFFSLEQVASTTLAPCKQSARLEREETETQVEKRERKKDTGKSLTLLPDVWSVSADHYELAKKLGLSIDAVGEAASEMRAWSLGNGEKRRDWDMVFNNWLRRNSRNGPRRFAALHDDSRSLTKAADKLIEQAKRGEFTFGPRPGISPEPSANIVQLLPKGRSDGT